MANSAPAAATMDPDTISLLIKKLLEDNKPKAELPDQAEIAGAPVAPSQTTPPPNQNQPPPTKSIAPQIPQNQALTNAILNMGQIMPVQKTQALPAEDSGLASLLKNGPGDNVKNASASFQSIGKLLALLG